MSAPLNAVGRISGVPECLPICSRGAATFSSSKESQFFDVGWSSKNFICASSEVKLSNQQRTVCKNDLGGRADGEDVTPARFIYLALRASLTLIVLIFPLKLPMSVENGRS